MPDVLAPVRRDRIVCRTRFSSWDGVLAADHERLPDPDGCGSWLSSNSTPGLWSVPDRTRRFSGGPVWKVLSAIGSAHLPRPGASSRRLAVGVFGPPPRS